MHTLHSAGEIHRFRGAGRVLICTLALTCCSYSPYELYYLLDTLCRFGCRTMSEPTPGSHMCPQGVLPSSSLMGMAAQV